VRRAALACALLLLFACSSTSERSSSSASLAPAAGGPSAGCTGPPLAPGETTERLTSGGVDYTFFRHVPATYTGATPTPLVVDLHGYAESAAIHTQLSGLGPFGDAHGFVTVTPQGPGAVPLWNTTLGGPDLAFIGALLDTVEATVCIDEARVFVAGMSNGAMMTSAVACEYADRVAAVAPVAGLTSFAGCHPSRPVPIISFHGTADGFVAYDGGYGPSVAKLPAPDGSGRTLGDLGVLTGAGPPSIPANLATWATLDGCSDAPPSQTAVTSDVTLIAYAGCAVELYRVTGGGHAWPGSALSAAIENIVGPTTMSISADELIWDFFVAHPLR
jgi:polyhydroxybutyrate depolymerase